MKNRAYHYGTKHSPYEAMFGVSSVLPANMNTKLKTKKELQVTLESIHILSNDNENNEVDDDEDQIIEKQTKTR